MRPFRQKLMLRRQKAAEMKEALANVVTSMDKIRADIEASKHTKRTTAGHFVKPTYIVPCDTCARPLDLCGPRAGNRKFDIGGSYRCLECQDKSQQPNQGE